MRALVLALAATVALVAIGCAAPAEPEQPSAKKEFERLYKDYSARYHEKMVASTERITGAQIAAEAARIWNDVFGPHKDLLRRRVKEIIDELNDAPAIDEDLYAEIAKGSRIEPAEDQPKGIVLKHFLWSPLGAAQAGLNTWLARVLTPESFAKRSVVSANAQLFWEAIDRNIERPKLMMRQGPMVFIVEVSNQGNYYQLENIRWLRPKSMGPIKIQQPPETPAETPETPPGEQPPEQPAETPAETPETKPAEGAEPKPAEGGATEAPKG